MRRSLALLVSLLALAACGAGASATTQGYAVQVTRAAALVSGLAAIDSTYSGASAQHLYTDVKGLQLDQQQGVHSCMEDLVGHQFALTFTDNGQTILQAQADASGCRYVQYDGKTFDSTDQLWSDLSQLIGRPV